MAAPGQTPRMSKPATEERPIAENRKARFDYFIEDQIEAGIALTGWEVKALRAARGNLKESYAIFRDNEVWLLGANIAPLPSASTHVDPDPVRLRKLLLHRREIDQLRSNVDRDSYTVVPLAMLGLIAPFQLRWGLSPPRLPVGRPLVAVLGFIGLLLAGLLLREGVHLAAHYVIGRVPRGAARLGGTGAGLTPRVRCAVLLPARAYRAILLSPGLLLGVVPGIAGIVVGSWLLIIWALWMLVAAGGDLAALWAMRGLPGNTPVRAHPSRPGCHYFASDEYVQNIDN